MGKNDVQFPDGMNSRTPKFTGWSVWINVINLRTRAVHIPWIHLTMWPFCESYKWRDMRGRVRGDLHGSICLLNLFFLFHLCMEEEKMAFEVEAVWKLRRWDYTVGCDSPLLWPEHWQTTQTLVHHHCWMLDGFFFSNLLKNPYILPKYRKDRNVNNLVLFTTLVEKWFKIGTEFKSKKKKINK